MNFPKGEKYCFVNGEIIAVYGVRNDAFMTRWRRRVWLITASDHIGPHRTTSDCVCKRQIAISKALELTSGRERATRRVVSLLQVRPPQKQYSICLLYAGDVVGCHGGRRQHPRSHWRRDKLITFNARTDSVETNTVWVTTLTINKLIVQINWLY